MARVAVIQRPPVWLDREATLRAAVASVQEAAREGAQLLVFPEAFVPGYPAWIWRLRPGPDMGLTEKIHALWAAQAVNLAAQHLTPLQQAAQEHGVTIVCGIDELDTAGGSTVYNSVVVIGPSGELINRHRKLMPTNPERMVWGFGDASGLKVVDTPVGRVGTLICWESYMPLARYALYAQGLQIYVTPTYDNGERTLATMQHIAREGGCWVVSCGIAFQARDLPEDLPGRSELFRDPDEWINTGDSVVVAPGGKIVAGPLHQQRGILYAELDLERIGAARRSLDVTGHYARPDIFQLQVNDRPQRPVTFTASSDRHG